MSFELKGNFFNNEFIQPPLTGSDSVEKWITRTSPADSSQTLWKLPIHYGHVDGVLESAINGFKEWRKSSIEDRISLLKKYQEQLVTKKEEIARAISLEMGKPYWEALTEAAALIAKVDVTISDSLPRVTSKIYNDIMPSTNGYIHYKPIGPCFIIGPFNFPCHLANGQITSALMAGNTIIFKPSEKTCYSAQLMFECLANAGFPTGVVNLVQGDGEIARRILKSRDIKAVFFTGSKDIGKSILKQTHEDLGKLVSLELGGKNPAIVHSDVNVDYVLGELIKGAFLTTGQRCTSTAIVPIHRSICEEVVSKFHDLSKRIIVDHPIEHEEVPFMGPLVDQQSLDTYLLYVGMAKREGLTEIMRGKKLEKGFDGHYVSPSIHLADKWDDKSHFLSSEIFGPNCTFIPYDEIEEAIEIANKTEYGLAASIFTKDHSLYQLALRDLDHGYVNLNRSTVGASAKLPFGGVKNSGNYHPAAVTTIDACVYQQASLEILKEEEIDLDSILGLKK
ncbi:aldehyde dehydrogenase family protein [Halobacteriovorax sp. JY17]|uniref:aldehyde dehydrogenase family protein n=1 Tax=Halobacteriovorax sp. JY17 TaxID=2014617 RepID=UPI000C5562AA|nr:aldehyde dehydrogenase family protein [Halobacteriovorax sp. JY17]PIK14244.1 MAG: N-succinylglutamate 5-semialdehyde dehydrogenase [Halobacteriovorax sp. JY17]